MVIKKSVSSVDGMASPSAIQSYRASIGSVGGQNQQGSWKKKGVRIRISFLGQVYAAEQGL